MSKYRERANKIKAAGEAQRGNFEPSGAPKRVYEYWLKYSKTQHASDVRDGWKKENFCHFWRVVFIWAPLMKARRTVGKFETPILATLAILVVLAVIASIVLVVIQEGILAVLLGALGIVGLVLGLIALAVGCHWFTDKYPTFSHRAAAALIVIGLFGVLYALGGAFLGAVWGLTVPVAAFTTAIILWLKADAISDRIEGRRTARQEELAALRDEPVDYREPGRISKFLSGLGDFIILIAQVVRVNKWKICPTVEIKSS